MRNRQEDSFMLRRIGVALAAIALLLPLQVSAQKGWTVILPFFAIIFHFKEVICSEEIIGCQTEQ
jgi:hypothetical protein